MLPTASAQTDSPVPPASIPKVAADSGAPIQPIESIPAAPNTDPLLTPQAPLLPQAASSQPPSKAASGTVDGTPLNDYWRNGLRFEAPDKSFSLFVGGRFQFDSVSYLTTQTLRNNVPGTNALEDGVSFRRIRFDVGGTIYDNIEFFVQLDFANGFLATPAGSRLTNSTYPTDVWLTFKELPVVGNMRVGNQKPLYSFEHMMSSRFLTFLERSLGYDAFAEGFNNGFAPGVTIYDTYAEKRGTWAVGLFKDTRSPFGWNVGRNELEVNGRFTYLPMYEDSGKKLIHVGVGGAHRDLDDDQARFRARFDARNSPSTFSSLLADTGLFYGSRQQILVPELAAVHGPLSFQAEAYTSWVEGVVTENADGVRIAPQGTVFFWSCYAEAAYFLTGEHREYNKDAATFGRVVPRSRVKWNRNGFTGLGALQLAARYSYLDLNSKGVTGGRAHDMTLGMNWFLNPNMKMQFNYFLTSRDAANTAGDGLIHGFATRMAIDW